MNMLTFAAISLISGFAFATDRTSPPAAIALGMAELKCESSSLGVSSASSVKEFEADALCMMATVCTVLTPFTHESRNAKTYWDKDSQFTLTYACKAEAGACPAARTCAREASSPEKLFSWTKAKVSASSTRNPGDGMACRHSNPIEPRALVRAKDKDWKQADAVCASTVTCDPKIGDQVAVCKPRKANLSTYEIECPSAMDCVAERFPLDKPKVDVAARPHGGTPAQTVSNSSSSTHSTGDQKR